MTKHEQAVSNIRGMYLENMFDENTSIDIEMVLSYVNSLEGQLAMTEIDLSNCNEYRQAKEGK